MALALTAQEETKSVSKWRLYLLRGLYFLNFISLAFDNWSAVLFPQESLGVLGGVAISFWAGFSLLNLLGVRYPLKMLPVLMLQFLYKGAWIAGTFLPAYTAGTVDPGIQEFFWVCIAGIGLNLIILPWGYLYRDWVRPFFKVKQHPA
ncbi:MAG TPA: hypothetical protein DCR93_10520 [Cytophagales bacterium]|nr:hypothetical protein [Cytophagales bacterium]HAP59905.1 hypothetical protein [Cytophagales bacterium]